MKAIFASKLYKASPRKEKIKAALNNPINSELVGQLANYLDEEYRLNEDSQPTTNHSSPEGNESETSNDDFKAAGGGFHGGIPRMGNGLNSPELEDDVEPTGDDISNEGDEPVSEVLNDDIPEESIDEVSEEEVESATDIESSTSLTDTDVLGVRNLLENDESTCGVDRIVTKDDEVWFYYDDSINLNKVMTPVIEKLESSEWDNLEFNRLARTSNAIVFQIRER